MNLSGRQTERTRKQLQLLCFPFYLVANGVSVFLHLASVTPRRSERCAHASGFNFVSFSHVFSLFLN